MAFDGIVTNSLVSELNKKLIGGRVDRVYQPEEDEVYLHIRSMGKNYILLLSASNNNPRFHLTEQVKKNPMEPPMFCMVLRKYLIGSTILNIEQLMMDRVIFIDIASRDELGIDSEKRIIVEIMGRHSNIIIIDRESNKILDSIKRVSEDMSRVRQIFPGIEYNLPPLQDKFNPLESNKNEFDKLLKEEKESRQIFRFFYINYHGLSPLISKEFCYTANIDPKSKVKNLSDDEIKKLYFSFSDHMNLVKEDKFTPNLVYEEYENRILAFHALKINQFNNSYTEKYKSMSKMLDFYYSEKDLIDRINQKSQSLKRIINLQLERSENKLKKQRKEYKESLNRDKYKIYADLISANIHKMDRGLSEIQVENFYDENLEKITIPLNKKHSPAENAENYYKKYSRLKNASKIVRGQIPHTKDEILYLENVLVSINNSTDLESLDEIRDELIKEGYIRGKIGKKNKQNKESKPHHYISSDGLDIFVGKNNRQNDELTFKTSHREDIWLHVQKMPGSHVLIRNAGQEVPNKTLKEAALLAAFYSSGRTSNNVPIDYTERKHVRKPRGAKAGLVIYDNFETIFATPSRDKIKKIKKK